MVYDVDRAGIKARLCGTARASAEVVVVVENVVHEDVVIAPDNCPLRAVVHRGVLGDRDVGRGGS